MAPRCPPPILPDRWLTRNPFTSALCEQLDARSPGRTSEDPTPPTAIVASSFESVYPAATFGEAYASYELPWPPPKMPLGTRHRSVLPTGTATQRHCNAVASRAASLIRRGVDENQKIESAQQTTVEVDAWEALENSRSMEVAQGLRSARRVRAHGAGLAARASLALRGEAYKERRRLASEHVETEEEQVFQQRYAAASARDSIRRERASRLVHPKILARRSRSVDIAERLRSFKVRCDRLDVWEEEHQALTEMALRALGKA